LLIGAATLGCLVATSCERPRAIARTEETAVNSQVPVHAAEVTVPVADTDTEPSEPLACTPKSVGAGDTITLRMKSPHGGYLSVTRADGTVYFLVYPQLGDPRRKYSVVPSEAFKQLRTFRLSADIRVPPRVYGRDTIPEQVFASPGRYELRMGENLESDFGPKTFACHINVLTHR
jgi:hypothetical protein